MEDKGRTKGGNVGHSMKTYNGRPAQLGSMYFEYNECGLSKRKFCVGYCECGKKVGLTSAELQDFSEHMPLAPVQFIAKLLKTRVIIPR